MNDHVSRDCPIGNIQILATHNSGSYSSANTILVRCQDRNIREQLEDGVRCFDIRVCAQEKPSPLGGFFMHHNGHFPDVGYGDDVLRQRFEPAMRSIRDFLSCPESANELVIIKLSGRKKADPVLHPWPAMNETQERYVLDEISNVFGALLYDLRPKPGTTYGQVLASGKRVLLFTDELYHTEGVLPNGAPKPVYPWMHKASEHFDYGYKDIQSSSGGTIGEKVEAVSAAVTTAVIQRAVNDGQPGARTFLDCYFNMAGVGVFDLANWTANPLAIRLIGLVSATIPLGTSTALVKGTNIMSLDYYNHPLPTLLMDMIILNNMNMKNTGLFRKFPETAAQVQPPVAGR